MALRIFRYVVEFLEALGQGFITPTFAFLGRLPVGCQKRRTFFWNLLYTGTPPPSFVICVARTVGAFFGIAPAVILEILLFPYNRRARRIAWEAEAVSQ